MSDDDDAERRASMPGMQPAQRPAATTCKRQAGRAQHTHTPARQELLAPAHPRQPCDWPTDRRPCSGRDVKASGYAS